jgi:hypothetical protein
MTMRKRQILQQMMQSVAQRASRNRVRHMMQQQEPLPEYPEDDGPLTDSQIKQIKQSVRTKYA